MSLKYQDVGYLVWEYTLQFPKILLRSSTASVAFVWLDGSAPRVLPPSAILSAPGTEMAPPPPPPPPLPPPPAPPTPVSPVKPVPPTASSMPLFLGHAGATGAVDSIEGLAEPEKFHRIELDFATDRATAGMKKTEILFTGKRGTLEFGQAIVTVPYKHQTGTVEVPGWYNIFGPDKTRHFTIEHEQIVSAAAWEGALRAATARSGRNAVLLFVRAYKNSFDDALFRTAQIAYHVHFRGAVAMFSWPSTNSVAGYMVDANNADWSRAHFKAAFKRVVDATHSSEIYIIAHSMGNQVVTRSLVELANSDPEFTR